MTHARLWILLCLATLMAGCLLHFARGYSRWDQHGHAWGCDDAFISYRYARNFAQGQGLVFNEGERVEGYSNFLYILLLTPSFMVTDGLGVYYVAFALNLVLITISFLLFVAQVGRRLGPESARAAAALFALCPVTWVWVASGLETILVLLLQLVAWIALDRIEEGAGMGMLCLLSASLALSFFARPEGVMVTVVVVVHSLMRRRWRLAAWCVLGVGLAAAPYLYWKYSYYGYLLPNTYYAKVSGPLTARMLNAATQLRDIVLRQGLLPHLLALAFALIVLFRRPGSNFWTSVRQIPFEAGMAVCLLGFWTYVGGDHLGERFLLLLYPLGCAVWLTVVFPRTSRGVQLLLVALLCALQMAPLATDARFDYGREKYDLWVTLGDYLKEHGQGRTLAIDGAGKVPFLSGLKTIDMLGLNDVYLAHREASFFNPGHNRHDADYVLSRKPDLIAAWVRTGDLDLAWGLDREKYQKAGYDLKYLVSVEKDLEPVNIVDVSSTTTESISDLLDRGFYYAVLEKDSR